MWRGPYKRIMGTRTARVAKQTTTMDGGIGRHRRQQVCPSEFVASSSSGKKLHRAHLKRERREQRISPQRQRQQHQLQLQLQLKLYEPPNAWLQPLHHQYQQQQPPPPPTPSSFYPQPPIMLHPQHPPPWPSVAPSFVRVHDGDALHQQHEPPRHHSTPSPPQQSTQRPAVPGSQTTTAVVAPEFTCRPLDEWFAPWTEPAIKPNTGIPYPIVCWGWRLASSSNVIKKLHT